MDKPAGMTSHDVVARIRRSLGTRAVGHTGTLDPFATGLLIVLVGRGTRVARFVEGRDKTYRGVARLGVATDTDDGTGRETSRAAGPLPRVEEIRSAIAGLVGTMAQLPPAYSAKRVAGERSYRKARRGEAVALDPVSVTVHTLDLLDWDGERLTFRTRVSAGTYIRALARDLGEALGVGAHLVELRREAIGEHRLEHAIPVDRVARESPLVPLDEILRPLPAVALDETQFEEIRHGRALADAWGGGEEHVVLLFRGAVAAVARRDGARLHPTVVLAAP